MDFSRRDILSILGPGLLILGFLTYMFARQAYLVDDLSAPARANAEARCQEGREPAACLSLVEQHHDICVKKNTHTPKAFHTPTFDEPSYAICLEMGPEGARKLRNAQREATRRENAY